MGYSKKCKWIEGDNIQEYSSSVHTWKAHTSTTEFATAFNAIMTEYKDDNDKRAAAIETFLIDKAQKAGVIKETKRRVYKNPNRWEKILAPWFNEDC